MNEEAGSWKRLYEHSNKAALEWAEKCGRLQMDLRYTQYLLEVARRKYALLGGEYNPKWPCLSKWETFQAFKENPQYLLPVPLNQKEAADKDILDLFEQSSNQI